MSLAQLLSINHYRRRTCIAAFFGCLFLLGLSITRDYGLQSDDEAQRMTGEVSLLYVFKQLPLKVQQRLLPASKAELIKQKGNIKLHTYRDRDYGVAFELPAAIIEQVLCLHDTRQKFLLRHYLVFFVFFGGVLAFYKIVEQRYISWPLGLLGSLLFILSPRQFADSFYNSKDAVFMALFTVAVATSIYWLRHPTWRRALLHALVCALAIDVRLMGLLVPVATLGLTALRTVRGEYPNWRHTVMNTGLYITTLGILIVLCWPFLWEAPLTNFIVAWLAMSHFRVDGEILYAGQFVQVRHLPWHYIPRWIGLTEPLFYLVCYSVGTIVTLATMLQRRARMYEAQEWQDILFLGLSLIPIITVISLQSMLYNGWRQLYFLHPILLLVALRGLVATWQWCPASIWLQRVWRPIASFITIGALGLIAIQMVLLHPLQNVYFNALAPAQVEKYYETDYWLMSMRPALDWIAQHDARPQIKVSTSFDRVDKGYSLAGYALLQNWLILPSTIQSRLTIVEHRAQANYVVVLAGFHQGPVPYTQPVYTLQAGPAHLLSIYRLH